MPHDGKLTNFFDDQFGHYNKTGLIKTPVLSMQDIYIFEKGRSAYTILKIKNTINKKKSSGPDFDNQTGSKSA